MFFGYDQYSYYVTPGGTDMRKGPDSLARLVYESLSLDAHSKSMFLENVKHFFQSENLLTA